ncbi:LuxR family transcriptional regulator [Mycobacterium sp. SMC-18]|uniref:LuxR family transcriptional regulator n=1 Tax=Mycobacterium sp. SMC-18 TaxID=3381629 RepID=UPI0038767808
MDEGDVLAELVRAHADLERLTAELADTRERRRRAAGWLVEHGRGTTWIAAQLGVTRQAVDGFLKYKERKATPPRPPTGSSI